MSALARYPVPQATPAGRVVGPRVYFRLEPAPDPVLAFLRPLRGLEATKGGRVDEPRLYFRLEAAVVVGGVLPGSLGLMGIGI